ncbi:hypothetical protein MtrunA17_Chr3g0142801 [Medicago truncatula]|uniref:Transmembrane protein n=1 Tax=Medicago truncatula TaxID=3880 RepID=A0A396J002_MEDTR|nr:hypothetical protein MtrunA17_Chr3g0142801 [Medicago truncatula]
MSFFDLILIIQLNVHCIYSEPSTPIFFHFSPSSLFLFFIIFKIIFMNIHSKKR